MPLNPINPFPDNATLFGVIAGSADSDYESAVQGILGTVQQSGDAGAAALADTSVIDSLETPTVLTPPVSSVSPSSTDALGSFPDNSTLFATLTGGIPADYQSAIQGAIGAIQQFGAGAAATVDTSSVSSLLPSSAPKAPPAASGFQLVGMVDTTTGVSTAGAATAYSGPVSYLAAEFIQITTDSLAISTSQPSVFIVTGGGDDAVEVFSGDNVISAGGGSNYLTGGTGNDTFFLDANSPTATWDTIVNFHSGDAVTIFGFIPGVSKFSFDDTVDGAVNAKGATMRIDFNGTGATNASVSFAGLTVDQGKALLSTTGTTAEGKDYLYLTH